MLPARIVTFMPWTEIKEPDPQPEREIVVQAEVVFEREEAPPDEVEIGQWYWINPQQDNATDEDDFSMAGEGSVSGVLEEDISGYEEEEESDEDDEEDGKKKREPDWLGCVVQVGSNFVRVKAPNGHATRIHVDKWRQTARRELNYQQFIDEKITHFRQTIQALVHEAQEITRRLGVSDKPSLGHVQESQTTALVACNSANDPDEYKKALIKAKDVDLPALFNKIESSTRQLSNWMQAETLPLEAQVRSIQGAKGAIEGRIFNVSIYAGLSENVIQFADGDPAEFHEKLHAMQRRGYMDEECLLNYRHGGMDFEGINGFNEWLAEPENRDRILPFQRCLLAMRVRRHRKYRPDYGSLETAWMNMQLADLDKLTFLYVRNGEKLYLIQSKLDFGHLIFPDQSLLNLDGPMMCKVDERKVEEMITVNEWEELCKDYDEAVVEAERETERYNQWTKDNPDESWVKNPYRYRDHPWHNPYEEYEPFNDSSVYFDEMKKHIADQIEQYNRIVLVIQGLLDRSEMLHPHPPAKLWHHKDFEMMIRLVYDGTNVMHHGDPPDIEAYIHRLNSKLKVGSLTIGQDDFWQRAMAKVENARRDRSYRSNGGYRPTHVKPYGNPGPGVIGKITKLTRTGKATFEWVRQRVRHHSWYENPKDEVKCKIVVPVAKLFNVSAYKLGDYKQFFADPRTREDYLAWAPLLIAAEEYHVGNIMPNGRRKITQKEIEEGWQQDEDGRRFRVTETKDEHCTEVAYEETIQEQNDAIEPDDEPDIGVTGDVDEEDE